MKQTLAIFIATFLSANVFSQQGTVEKYDVKSRHFANTGLVLVAGGGAVSLVGLILIGSDHHLINNHTVSSQGDWGLLLIASGGALAIASIPFYVLSSVMHKKSVRRNGGAAFLEMEKMSPASLAIAHTGSFPALGIRIAL